MKTNIGTIDRLLRFAIAVIIVALYTENIISGTFGIIMLVLATVLMFTSAVSFCPLYTLLGVNTCKINQK